MDNRFYLEWYFYAKSDFNQVLQMRKEKNPLYHIELYHLHQSIEKLLKLVIMMQTGSDEPPKTHDLLKLSRMASDSIPEIDLQQESILVLHEYLPRLRYPLGDRISAEDTADCLNNVEPVITLLCQKIDDLFKGVLNA